MARAREARRSAALDLADHGPPERAQHGELVARKTAARLTGKQVKHECRLDWYWDKASIIDRQHAAGIRFRRDWHLAVARPTLIGRYAPRLAGRSDFADSQLAARRRVSRAVALLGRELAAILIDVCCFDNWAAERLPRLREALTLLADQYGLARETADRTAPK